MFCNVTTHFLGSDRTLHLGGSQDLTANFSRSAVGCVGVNVEVQQSGVQPLDLSRVECVTCNLGWFQTQRKLDGCHNPNRTGAMNMRKELWIRKAGIRQPDAKLVGGESRQRAAHGVSLCTVRMLVLRIVEDRNVKRLYTFNKWHECEKLGSPKQRVVAAHHSYARGRGRWGAGGSQDLTANLSRSTVGRVGVNVEIQQSTV
jgi:hypothetical protein